ncbi:rhodanese-like domain-containing protein [Pediococcus stilesii]|uniref:Rhodanese-like domain-containing protein n=2 Tax=Pediococcus stilesii TaxID=331679 RepID=A0A5R9BTI4_9LACO|nr:rhodanese-like domain-containing protein [Pediococcus stilesii]TLQ03390.1 rhodanese-like domain-containing protein [Pediococcus stilesii]
MLKNINMDEFTKKIQKEDLNLIDVREVFEYQMGHIASAKNLPLSNLQDEVQTLDQNQTYYVICRSGARSANAGAYLDQLGFDIINVQGGMNAWRGEIV